MFNTIFLAAYNTMHTFYKIYLEDILSIIKCLYKYQTIFNGAKYDWKKKFRIENKRVKRFLSLVYRKYSIVTVAYKYF